MRHEAYIQRVFSNLLSKLNLKAFSLDWTNVTCLSIIIIDHAIWFVLGTDTHQISRLLACCFETRHENQSPQ